MHLLYHLIYPLSLPLLLTLTLATAPRTRAGISNLGINCRGDWVHCLGVEGILDAILQLTPLIQPRDIYASGKHIICFPADRIFFTLLLPSSSGFCLFLQGDPYSTNRILYPDGRSIAAINGSYIATLSQKLREHGCNSCSSIPLDPKNNPHKFGILTVNYVSDRENCGDKESGTNLCRPSITAQDDDNPYNLWAEIEAAQQQALQPVQAVPVSETVGLSTATYARPGASGTPIAGWLNSTGVTASVADGAGAVGGAGGAVGSGKGIGGGTGGVGPGTGNAVMDGQIGNWTGLTNTTADGEANLASSVASGHLAEGEGVPGTVSSSSSESSANGTDVSDESLDLGGGDGGGNGGGNRRKRWVRGKGISFRFLRGRR